MQRYGKSVVSCKVESHRCRVKTHCNKARLAFAQVFIYFCIGMRTILRIAYWLAAIALLAAILVSLDYTLAQAVLISLVFCPCALALEYWMPKARRTMDKRYLSLSVLVTVILLILVLHHSVWATLTNGGYRPEKELSPMLINPAFLGLLLTALSIGDYFWAKWLSGRFRQKVRTITFCSERKSVTLPMLDIAYVESNDTEVRVVTLSGESYRNKTCIGQWENLLGGVFLRIHRSYLVNKAAVSGIEADTLQLGETELPISRKYREDVLASFPPAK